jgi:T5SS/PEP-CTERM-associated repeat protein
VVLGSNGAAGRGDWLLAGSGTRASVSNILNIGLYASGSLALREGATLDSQRVRFGLFDTGNGVAEVRDGGVWRNAGEMAVGVSGGGQLIVGDGGSVSTAALSVGSNGRVDLIGGLLHTASLSGTGRFSWRGGTLQIEQNAALAAPLPAALALKPGMRMEVGGSLTVGSGAVLTLAGGSLAAGTLLLEGGAITAAEGGTLNLADVAMLRGRGNADVAVQGGAASIIELSGPLTIGDAGRADGFLFDGTLMVGSQRLTLNSAAQARLGFKTTLDHGGELQAANGLLLPAGARLQALGDTTLDARLQLEGTLASTGGTLTLRREVSGAGRFDGGTFAFLAGYDTGAGFAAISFGGADALFGPQSTLTLKIGGSTDRLTGLSLLDFHGSLRLVFDPTTGFENGASLPLLEFVTLSGDFDPSRIVIEGIDPARVNTSLLGTEGTVHIAAVPAPASAWMMLAGLMVLAGARQRGRYRQGR